MSFVMIENTKIRKKLRNAKARACFSLQNAINIMGTPISEIGCSTVGLAGIFIKF